MVLLFDDGKKQALSTGEIQTFPNEKFTEEEERLIPIKISSMIQLK